MLKNLPKKFKALSPSKSDFKVILKEDNRYHFFSPLTENDCGDLSLSEALDMFNNKGWSIIHDKWDKHIARMKDGIS
jgi:hypothetical protein